MPRGGKLAFILGFWSFALPGSQSTAEPPPGPPPLMLSFERVSAEAVHEVGTVISIGSTTDAVWVAAANPARAIKIDPAGKATSVTVSLPGDPCGGIAVDFGAVWIPLCASGAIARVDRETNAVTTVPLGALTPAGGSLATGVGSVWILADDQGTLLRIDPAAARAVADVYLPRGTAAIAFGAKSLWAAGGPANQVVQINPHTNVIDKSIAAPQSPRRLAVSDAAVWALGESGTALLRIDASNGRVAATVDLGAAVSGGAVAVGEGSIWVTASGTPLVRIDPRTSHVAQVFGGEGGGGPLAIGHGSLWMAVGPGTVWRIDPRFVAALR